MGLIDTLHGYIYSRWPYWCIGLGTGEHRLLRVIQPLLNFVFLFLNRFPSDTPQLDIGGLKPGKNAHRGLSRKATFADIYHGKVIRLDAALKIVSVDQKVQLSNLEHVIPYTKARDLILEEDNRILLLECPCRATRVNPCLPIDVCLIMGDPIVGFAEEHHPERSRLIDKAEAIDVLAAEAERGHVHHAFFKEATLGRFFAICNCCSCCCGAMQAHRNGVPMLASSGYVSVVDEDKCAACGTCIEKCPFDAIRMEDAQIRIDPQQCMGCGVCSGFCPQDALSLKRDSARSDPLEIDQLLAEIS
jgi:ferredoxin